MSTVPAQAQGPGDAELIESVRGGSAEAYGQLYERHVAAAYNLARQVSRSPTEADDLVSEAFAKVLDTLRSGGGPDAAFRAYLLTALRHTAYDRTRRERKVEYTDDVTTSGAPADAISVPFSDTAVAGLDRSLAARAFAALPERWQTVLWHTEVEGASPAEVAPILGISPNSVSALAYRAREGLRQAYLQVHLAETTADRCRATADRLGAWTRGGLSRRETAQVEAHLDECARCRALAAELAEVNGSLHGVLAPLVLGGAAAGYLAATGTAAKATALAGTAAAGGSGGVAGAVTSLPRQFAGLGVGAATVAAAVVVAMTVPPGPQRVPAAAPPAVAQSPAPKPPRNRPPRPRPPAPRPPAPQAPLPQPPAPGPTTQAPAPQVPGPPRRAPRQEQPQQQRQVPPQAPAPETAPSPQPPQQPAPTSESSRPPQSPPPPQSAPTTEPAPTTPPSTESLPTPDPGTPPQPGTPQLHVTPVDSVVLVRAGAAVDLPLTVTNDGTAASGGIRAALALPRGIRAEQAGAETLDARSAGAVNCPAGTGTVTCSYPRGLRPGGRVTLRFRLRADASASGGELTGSVRADGAADVRQVRVPVKVRPRDGVAVGATQLLPAARPPLVAVRATNTGERAGRIHLRYRTPARLVLGLGSFACRPGPGPANTSCTSVRPVRPGGRARLLLVVPRSLAVPVPFTARARLGTATDTVSLRIRPPVQLLRAPPPPSPPATAPATTPPATARADTPATGPPRR